MSIWMIHASGSPQGSVFRGLGSLAKVLFLGSFRGRFRVSGFGFRFRI